MNNAIILFDSNLTIINRFSNDKVISAIITRKLNDLDTIDVELIATEQVKNFMNATNFIGVYNSGKYYVYRITDLNYGRTISLTGVNIAIDELQATSVDAKYYLESQEVDVFNGINTALVNSGWIARNQDGLTFDKKKDVFYDYNDGYSILQYFSDKFKIEYSFSVELSENTITKRNIDIVKDYYRDERDIRGRYTQSINTNEITAKIDFSQKFTGARGLGKVINENTGERLTFKNINGTNSPAGQDYIGFENLKQQYPTFNNKYRLKTFIYDNIEDAQELFNTTYNEFVSEYVNIENKQFSANVIDVDTFIKNYNIRLGDYVLVKRIDINFYYVTKVIEIKINVLNKNKTTVGFGKIIHQTTAKRIKKLTKKYDDLDSKYQNLNNKYDDLNTGYKDLNNKYDDLNNRYDDLDDRVTILEGGSVDPEEPETNNTYFTYADVTILNEQYHAITGFTETGRQAFANGIETKLVFPSKDNNGNFINAIAGGFGGIKIQEYIYIKKHIVAMNGYNMFGGLETNYISFEDTGKTDEGLQIIQDYIFTGINLKSKYIYLPYGVRALNRDFLYNGGIDIVSISDYTNDIIGSSGINATTFKRKLVRTNKAIISNDFVIELTDTNANIVALSPQGAIKDTITVPEEIRSKPVKIAGSAFSQFYLTEHFILNNIQDTILPLTFAYMTALKTVKLNESIEVFDNEAFRNSTILEIITSVPSNLTTFNNGVFRSCTFEEFTIPSSVQFIGNDCFNGTNRLINLNMSSEVLSIGNSCFNGSTIQTISNFENNLVQVFGDSSFANTTNLKTKIVINEQATSIGVDAFRGSSITEVEFKPNVTEKGVSLKNRCFYNSFINDLILPDRVDFSTSGGSQFLGIKINTIEIPTEWIKIQASMFQNISGISTVSFVNTNVTTIESYAFNNTGLTSVVFDTSKLMTIRANAFTSTLINEVYLKTGSIVATNAFPPDTIIHYV